MLRRFDHLLGSDCIFDGMILYSPKQNLASHVRQPFPHSLILLTFPLFFSSKFSRRIRSLRSR